MTVREVHTRNGSVYKVNLYREKSEFLVGDKVKHRSQLPTFLHPRKAASNEVRPEKDVWRSVVRKEIVRMHYAKSGMERSVASTGMTQ
jgi:hypothetical protein